MSPRYLGATSPDHPSTDIGVHGIVASQSIGNAANQVIWFTDARPAVAFDQTPEALAVMDEWMLNIQAHPSRGVAGNKPSLAVDPCFTPAGVEIARGSGVWDGILNNKPAGARSPALYGSWQPSTAERARLKVLFPTGVCDYTKPDAGRPRRP